MVNSLPYLLKQLKMVGWTQKMLISAYRAYGLSHFVYSALMLDTCSEKDKAQMTSYQSKILKTIGLSHTRAKALHNIHPILERIEEISHRVLSRVFEGPTHPVP